MSVEISVALAPVVVQRSLRWPQNTALWGIPSYRIELIKSLVAFHEVIVVIAPARGDTLFPGHNSSCPPLAQGN